MSLDDSEKATRRLDNTLDPVTSRAVQFLASDPSFWDAIRTSWLVNHSWKPRVGWWATIPSTQPASSPLNERVLIEERHLLAADSDTAAGHLFLVRQLDGTKLRVQPEALTECPFVPWAVIKRHAVPKLAIAGIDPKSVDWEDLGEQFFKDCDPGSATASPHSHEPEDDCAAAAPRA